MTFAERYVETDGFSIRYLDGGEGLTVVCIHGAGGLRVTRAHELLAERHRIVAFELPGFGASRVNERSGSLRELAATIRGAIGALGIERHSLWGISFGAKLALWMAVADPDRIDALVLSAPAAIRIDDRPLPAAQELPAVLYAHPERRPPQPPLSPDIDSKQRALVNRLIGPPRDAEIERAMSELHVPTLVLFGSEDPLTPPELGRHYRELLPSCEFLIVYDAAHALYEERPEAFVRAVSDFLDHHDEFAVRRESGLLYP
jgi:pimeloyl-ACP methyl ester carboxylesterase